jgi:parvulin-like peptidyl-prolyl isomerase
MFHKFVVLIAATLPVAGAADVRIVEEIVAKINGDIITRGEIAHQRQLLEEEARRQGITGARLEEAVKQEQRDALRNQIDQLLLVQKGKDLNIKIDADVTRRMAEIQVQSKISDPDQFHTYVREQTGMSYEDFKQQMTNQLLTQRVISEEISSKISIPEADLRKYYEEHKTEFTREEQVFLSQLLISTEGKTPQQVAAAQKKAADLVARARKGEKFSDLVRDNSDDVATAKDGGSLPPYKRSDHLMVKEIEDLVFQQKKGYVTDPIKTAVGLLILRVDERFEAGQASFEEVKEEVTQKLASPRMEPKVREYLTKLRQDAFLEIKDGYVDSGAAPNKDTRWKDAVELKPQTTTKEEVAARHKKKFLGVIPHGGKAKPAAADPAPAKSVSEDPPAKP